MVSSGSAGTVTINDGATELYTASVTSSDDTVTYTTDTTQLTATGSHSITAVFTSGGGSAYSDGASAPLDVVVIPTTLPSGVVNEVPSAATPARYNGREFGSSAGRRRADLRQRVRRPAGRER